MKFKTSSAKKALKQPMGYGAKTALIIGLAMAGVFSLWGLWDLAQWNILYPGKPYSFPFQLVSMPWWIAGDILVGVAAFCIFVLAIMRSGKK
jgi:hypothetical protein